MKKVCIIGTGYVGLVTGACLADMKNRVICVDSDVEKIKMLKRGKVPIFEPGLEEIIRRNTASKRLSFTTSVAEGVRNSEIVFIAVSTPPKADGTADLTSVAMVAREVAEAMDGYRLIVDKSTVPVRTGEKVAETIKRYNRKNVDFDVASNPEFLREGSAISDTMVPDRIVIGVSSARAAKILKELYAPLKAPVIVTDIKSAEIIKHASNSFLAMKISFANALAQICELAGANVLQVVEGMGLDKRIGKAFLNAGIGYGGSCFPKDVAAFIKISEELGYDFHLLRLVEEINREQRARFVKKIEETLWIIKDKTIGVLGLAFKPNTDDMRSAPSIDIIAALQREGAFVKAYDPEATAVARRLMKGVKFCKSAYEVARGSDALLVVTEWDEFSKLNIDRIRSLMAHPIIIDGRNIFDPAVMEEKGFIYKSIGR
ncbi:MAG: UDP-glucose/GDP-mannose dehydrogenase family protein [Candidatus Aureabacteria bacterium]|jgi:UDPglucose 6-dehydrogenase|nr:UDP-glucose/GDP-mannose dehydrogenase family protein [Candidatus Auribacterota bacterium]NLW93611.1 UDP-glucose/GDP-mannose dehydrogenase family protein [Chlamydiota bacterium]HOE28023.1 UDP-glucose/GDP-mannose dehydrogenase family protein [bacterium]HQM52636.1 UDP-glucose/GDP-mannose dehydrogenase family protein [bacterium]